MKKYSYQKTKMKKWLTYGAAVVVAVIISVVAFKKLSPEAEKAV